jgi:hypothetical protein
VLFAIDGKIEKLCNGIQVFRLGGKEIFKAGSGAKLLQNVLTDCPEVSTVMYEM